MKKDPFFRLEECEWGAFSVDLLKLTSILFIVNLGFMGRNEFISISESEKRSTCTACSRVGKFGGKQVLRPACHPNWAFCAFLGVCEELDEGL